MLTRARAVVSGLLNAAAFIVIIVGGVVAGCALSLVEEAQSETRKRNAADRPADKR
jgi:hypothetical protein